MSHNAEKLGAIIRERRKLLGYKTQKDLAEVTGVLRKRISEMETGRYTGRIIDMYRVAGQLGLELDLKVTSRPTLKDLAELFPPEED